MAGTSAARIIVRFQWLFKIGGPAHWDGPLLGLAHIQVSYIHDLVFYLANRVVLVVSWKHRPTLPD